MEYRLMLSLNKLEVVLFDWDNTLAETREALVFSINEVLADYNMPEWNAVKNLRDKDLSFRDNFANIFGAKAQEAYERYSEKYKKNVPGCLKKPEGADEVIAFLKKHDKKLAVMTNKDRKLFEFEYPFLYGNNLFDKIVCGHEAQRDKPFPEYALYTLRGMIDKDKINDRTVWIVGDSHQDVECALNSRTLPILVGKPIWEEEVEQKEEIVRFENFEEFSKAVISLTK